MCVGSNLILLPFPLDKIVGFRVGSYRSGDLTVAEPTHCVNVPAAAKHICKVKFTTLLLYLVFINPVGGYLIPPVRCRGSIVRKFELCRSLDD